MKNKKDKKTNILSKSQGNIENETHNEAKNKTQTKAETQIKMDHENSCNDGITVGVNPDLIALIKNCNQSENVATLFHFENQPQIENRNDIFFFREFILNLIITYFLAV